MSSSKKLTPVEVREVEELYQRARKAFEEVEFWPQEKVDEMVAAVGWEWQKPEVARELARLAVDESGIGVYEDKVAKIQSKTKGTLWDMKGVNTCGLVEKDKADGRRSQRSPLHESRVHCLLHWAESFENQKCHDRLPPPSNPGQFLSYGRVCP